MSDHVPVAHVESEFEREMQCKYSDKPFPLGGSEFWKGHNWFFYGYKYFASVDEWQIIYHDRRHWIHGMIQETEMTWIDDRIKERGIHLHDGHQFWESPEAKRLLNDYIHDHYASSPHYDNPEAKWIANIAIEQFKKIFSTSFVYSACPECCAAVHRV